MLENMLVIFQHVWNAALRLQFFLACFLHLDQIQLLENMFVIFQLVWNAALRPLISFTQTAAVFLRASLIWIKLCVCVGAPGVPVPGDEALRAPC